MVLPAALRSLQYSLEEPFLRCTGPRGVGEAREAGLRAARLP